MEGNRKQYGKTWHKLLNEDDSVLAARYLKKLKNGESAEEFKAEFIKVINRKVPNTDEFIYGAVVALEGANLDKLFSELRKVNVILAKSGIKLNFQNILEDVNEILNEKAINVFQARRNADVVSPAIEQIFSDYINEILTRKAIEYTLAELDNTNDNNFNV